MRLRIPLLIAAAAVGVAALGFNTLGRRHTGVLAELARTQPERVFAARMSITAEYRPCDTARAPAGGTIPLHVCGAGEDAPRLVDRLAAAAQSADPDSLQASALSAIVWWDRTEPSHDAALDQLVAALRLAPGSVPVLVDLSAAHLVRAERRQNPRDLFQGLQYALEALDLDSVNQAALFNRALALELAGLDMQALRAWEAYLAEDGASPWADEARGRQRALRTERVAANEPPPGARAAEAEVIAFAHRNPQRARLMGWEDVLGRWGRAVMAGHADSAAALLTLAERLGNGVARTRGRDASLADAVRAIRAAESDAAATRRLARAHAAYAAGQALLRMPDSAAEDSFALAIDLQPPSPLLVTWARAGYAGRQVLLGVPGQGAVFQRLRAGADSVRHPALAARLRWMWGTAERRGGTYAQRREQYRGAAASFAAAGEMEHVGAMRYMEGEAAYYQGDTLAAYHLMHRALGILRSTPDSRWRHDLLYMLAEFTAAAGMPLAAVPIQDEGVWIAERSDPISRVESLLGRALVGAAAGDVDGATRHVRAAAAALDTMPESDELKSFGKRLGYYEAVVALAAHRLPPAASLDAAIASFADQNVTWLILTLLLRADARLAAGKPDSAVADLDRSLAELRRLSEEEAAGLRAGMMEQVRSRIDQLVMLHLQNGDTLRALQALEGGRVSFGARGDRAAPPAPSAPPGQVAVDYALVGDTLLTWVLRGGDVHLVRQRIPRDTLLLAIEQAGALLQTSARAARATPQLQRLYDWLIRPVSARLGGTETPLVIVADGELAGVPFPALRDAAQGRYLVEQHPLRVASSLSGSAGPVPSARGGAVLLVADPEFAPRAHPGLDRLPGAGVEVDSLRTVYPGAVVLQGRGATRGRVAREAQRAGVIHYAGHAVFNDARPEQSFLVLAGDSAASRFTAAAVDSLDLGGVRLVVLSACRTLRARSGRSGGFTGLSGALLSAGAGGVVGSLWEVDDDLSQPLMLAFHRAYRQGGNPAAALRSAQLRMIRDRRSPAVWAGFRYVGR